MYALCFDTNFLIWAIQGVSRESQADMPIRARSLMAILREQPINLAVPAIAVAEFLAGLDSNIVSVFSDEILSQFQIWPFRNAESLIYAQISRRQRSVLQELRQESTSPSRQALRIDLLIIATALGHGATAVYSEDRHMGRLAEGLIEVRAMPPLPPPPATTV